MNDFKKIEVSRKEAEKIYNSGGIIYVSYKDIVRDINDGRATYAYTDCGISFSSICDAYMDRCIDVKFKTDKKSYEAYEMCKLMCNQRGEE